jgi:hypothetical protein
MWVGGSMRVCRAEVLLRVLGYAGGDLVIDV